MYQSLSIIITTATTSLSHFTASQIIKQSPLIPLVVTLVVTLVMTLMVSMRAPTSPGVEGETVGQRSLVSVSSQLSCRPAGG